MAWHAAWHESWLEPSHAPEQSLRPVPIVTVDFGDGRTVVRTLTGNSVHLVLDMDGRPVDARPGLVAPDVFLQQLEIAEGLVGLGHLRTGLGLTRYASRQHPDLSTSDVDDARAHARLGRPVAQGVR